jgi:hypothetical protein
LFCYGEVIDYTKPSLFGMLLFIAFIISEKIKIIVVVAFSGPKINARLDNNKKIDGF